MRRAVGAAALALAALVAVVVVSSPGRTAAPRQLHEGEHPHPEVHCVDVWGNDWCQARKAEGQCVENHVLTKCPGTCGACCLDAGHPDDAEYCSKIHLAGQCATMASECMKTCGVCELDAKLECSFEDGGRTSDFCFYQKSYNPTGAADFFEVSTFNDKLWTGPRKASDGIKFAHLDSEVSAANDCVFLTSPWGHLDCAHVLSFDYNLYARDYPQAMGTMAVDILVDGDTEGWKELWKADGTAKSCAAGWTQAVVSLCGEGLLPDEGSTARVRFHIKAGTDALSDMGIDNIELSTRVCGDGMRVFEFCDDGNTRDGDGCSSDCEIEEGFRCVATGGADDCSRLRCGDGVVSGDEECDDGNTKNGDGCSRECTLEEGFYCRAEPVPCLDACKAEAGQDVLYPGPSSCFAVAEFTPRLRHPEGGPAETGVSDGEPYAVGVLTVYKDGDFRGICPHAENWKLAQVACFELGYAIGEMADPADVPWVNDPPCGPTDRGTWDFGFLCDENAVKVADCDTCAATCARAAVVSCSYSGVCGDGFRRHSHEACDDGNDVDGDGCSADCQVEDGWTCTGGGWNSKDTCQYPVCGDGFRTADEECDDGCVEVTTGTGRNRVTTCEAQSGDGCSASCKVEPGYCCEGGSPTSVDICTAVGTIRLAPLTTGENPMALSGHLQVMDVDTTTQTCGWGSVCFHGFDLKDANNACEQVGAKYANGHPLWAQSPGIQSADLTMALPAVKFAGGCCMHGMPSEGMLYRCGRDAEAEPARCEKCDEVVVLTCGAEP